MVLFISGDQGDSCDDYFVLNDPTRNLEYLGYLGNAYCDQVDPSYCMMYYLQQSPGWQGAAWYRMAEPTGTTIPEEPVDSWHCNTEHPGWLKGHHPATPGEIINGKVKFSGIYDTFFDETQIQIKHCTNYYLYYLVDAPNSWSRYCGTSTTLIGNVKLQYSSI